MRGNTEPKQFERVEKKNANGHSVFVETLTHFSRSLVLFSHFIIPLKFFFSRVDTLVVWTGPRESVFGFDQKKKDECHVVGEV